MQSRLRRVVVVVRQLLIGEKSFEDRIRHRRCAAPPKRDRERTPWELYYRTSATFWEFLEPPPHLSALGTDLQYRTRATSVTSSSFWVSAASPLPVRTSYVYVP